jgi:outer membrane lipoprotein-sorting protein
LGDRTVDLKENNMKLLAALALATLVASPALAQDPPTRAKARNAHATPAAGTYNQYGRTESRSRHSTNPAHDVYLPNGFYVGSDPDSRIRSELLRDSSSVPE